MSASTVHWRTLPASDRQEAKLFEALQRKAMSEIGELLDGFGQDGGMRDMLFALADPNGGDEVLRARALLARAPAEVAMAIDYVEQVAAQLRSCQPDLPVHFDLAAACLSLSDWCGVRCLRPGRSGRRSRAGDAMTKSAMSLAGRVRQPGSAPTSRP